MNSITSLFFSACFILTLMGCGDRFSSHVIRQKGLVHCGAEQPTSLNPQLTDGGIIPDSVSRQLFERLVQLDLKNFSPIPMLATDWKVTRDGKEYLFTLRQNVHFHQNKHFIPSRALNAEDVVFSFTRIIDKNHPFHAISPQGYPWFESLRFSQLLKKVEAVNQHQVRFTLKHADASFLSILASSYAVIHSAEYAQQLIDANQLWLMDSQPIGTGAFWLKDYQHQLIRLKKHPLFRENNSKFSADNSKLEQVIYDIDNRGISQLTKLIADECDVIDNISPKQLSVVKHDPAFAVLPQAAMNVAFLTLNTEHAILSRQSVRKAVNYAINKSALVNSIYHGSGMVASSILPPSSWAHNSKVDIAYNPQLAKSLLAQAGLVQGFTLDLLVPSTPRPYNPNPLKMAQLIKADLAKINIKVNILTKKNINNKLWKKEILNLGMVLEGWIADNADPDNFFRPSLSCDAISTGLNLSNWCNKDYEQLLDSAINMQNKNKRKALYAKLQQLIGETLPIIPLTHGTYYKVINSKIKGYKTTPLGDKSFANVTRDQ